MIELWPDTESERIFFPSLSSQLDVVVTTIPLNGSVIRTTSPLLVTTDAVSSSGVRDKCRFYVNFKSRS